MKQFYYLIWFSIVSCLVGIAALPATAQTLMTKINDATVTNASPTPAPGAILELESINKGFLLPRMTTAQRDAIDPANRPDGLLIFNTTTGCLDNWSALKSLWLSICGTMPPAIFSINAIQCSQVQAQGTYTQGVTLTGSNYLSIPVTITQAGTYTINATTSNGYYFASNGTFPSAGAFTVNVPGVGTPAIGTATGDEVTISLNGVVSSCKPKVVVGTANVSYNISCSGAVVAGTYMIGVPLTSANTATINVNVSQTGFYSIKSDTVNGMTFSGTGNYTSTGAQTVKLYGSGTPLTSGASSFTLTSNSSTSPSCTGLSVTVSSVAYTMDCANALQQGTYMQDVPLTSSNTIKLPVNVTATGSYNITSNTVNGMQFSASGNFTSLGATQVILTGSGKPATAGTSSFTLTGNGATCSNLSVVVQSHPVSYTINCASVSVSGTYTYGTALTLANKITLSVNATYAGTYSISTNTAAGISFSGSGTLSVGTNTVVLQGSGTPTDGGTQSFSFNTNSAVSAGNCSASITIAYRAFRVLGLGGGIYQPGSATSTESARAILASQNNFGPNATSKVKTAGITIVDGGYPSATTLTNLINSNNIDIIVIGYAWAPDAAARNVLADFIKVKKKVVLAFTENDNAGEYLIGLLYPQYNPANQMPSFPGSAIYQFANINDPVLNGPFGDIRGKQWGSDLGGTHRLNSIDTYADAIVYSTGIVGSTTYANGVSTFRHANLGFLWNGDGGYIAGNVINTSRTIWPAKISGSYTPIPKPGYGESAYGGGANGVDVYNSIFYANAMAWAMQYILVNAP